MTLATVVAMAMFLGVILYALLGGPTSGPGSTTSPQATHASAQRSVLSSTTASARCGKPTTSG